ncbi:hypothetical protein [Geodermatophilus sp. URMC 62]|uniref:hypothetical protein n=1 Tax=Geodermatophilus sp. URMC 62 TaxID=3423414 RepID=UPI00406C1F6A
MTEKLKDDLQAAHHMRTAVVIVGADASIQTLGDRRLGDINIGPWEGMLHNGLHQFR